MFLVRVIQIMAAMIVGGLLYKLTMIGNLDIADQLMLFLFGILLTVITTVELLLEEKGETE